MDRFEELKKYKELMDEGVLTEEEFNALKKEFLSAPAFQSDSGSKVANKSTGGDKGVAVKKIRSEVPDINIPEIPVEEIKKDFIGDCKTLKKEGVKGLRKLSATTAVAIAVVVCIALVTALVLSSYIGSDNSYSGSTYGESTSSELTASEMETCVKYEIIKEIQEKQKSSHWNRNIDPYSCYININTYSREDDGIIAYGTVHMYDKYGNIVTKYISGSDYSANFEITLSNTGWTKSCEMY